MNYTMIKNWNHVVKKDDIIYHLGDFVDDDFSQLEHIKEFKAQLNGRISIILGNHDRYVSYSKWFDFGFDRVYDQPIVIDGFIMLSHEPLFLNDLANSNAKAYLNIHGHVHGNVYFNSHYVNVCAERINYSPVNLDKLVSASIEKVKEELIENENNECKEARK
jgi:calcineurin-like phosphoesterase family protein